MVRTYQVVSYLNTHVHTYLARTCLFVANLVEKGSCLFAAWIFLFYFEFCIA